MRHDPSSTGAGNPRAAAGGPRRFLRQRRTRVPALESLESRQLLAAVAASAPSGDGPTVLSVARFGFHTQPTVLAIRFSQPLDPARAQNTANYILRDHVSRPVTVVSADYLPESQTVVLRPRRQLNLHFHAALVVVGTSPTGVSNTSGVLLDGALTGVPGSNFSTRIARRNLLGPLPG